MAYQALYRTYRPRNFDEVVGQDVIVKTLQNALLNNKIAHAYLFSGPRGTGKTSIAKILAKAVNCEKSPTDNPCGQCPTCLAIQEGSISDVVEIDAASNNGVNEIRELRDKVKYLPSLGKYKVYIIDEVHMLTSQAFNALLKTLEEPPAYVIFILATTEPNKVPLTILSRCQRFDFRGISRKDIIRKLDEIRTHENILITDEAISEISRLAEGGLRDAISLFDQAVAFSDGEITLDDVYKVSGSVSKDNLLHLLTYILEKKASEALKLLNEIIEDGKEIPKVVSDLVMLLRDILVEKNVVFDTERATLYLEDFSKKFSNDRIYFYLDILNKTQNDIKWTNQKRAYLELAIIKMIDHEQLKQIDSTEQISMLMNKVNALELQITKLKSEPVRVVTTSAETKPLEEHVVKPVKTDELVYRKDITVDDVKEILMNGDVKKKTKLINNWENLLKIKEPHLQTVAGYLHEGNLVACSKDSFLLIYPDKTTCLMMLKDEYKKLALEVINSKDHIIDNYICLDEEAWLFLFNSFKEQWASGNKNPELPKLQLDIYETREEKWQPETVKLALDFFGEDIVIIKE
ncbi:MAG: DNA polymerase III subunit gamma/tau [Acholeplasmataceae bacterium]|nr:DNA polymerase III subunit gamma/tau [Acholeplasmataceae bacterium]